MELQINHSSELGTKQIRYIHYKTPGMLNSKYKRLVKNNFKRASNKTVFGLRQRTKSPKLCRMSHATSMVLKISVFVIAAIMIMIWV